ncbi:hypothetical protein AB0J52_15120, partial [Spirillospora sp. NPDC049652]
MSNDGGDTGLIPGLDALPDGPGGTTVPSGTSATPGRSARRQGGGSARGAAEGPAGKSASARGSAARGGAKAPRKGARVPAGHLPVARIAVDMSLPHLDRPFDYLVPSELDPKAVPGCRVRVRFAGQLVDGLLLERVQESDHDGRLSFLERVTSAEPVLAPEVAALAREVADRYAGTLADVLRLAIPPRHARAEGEPPREAAEPPEPPDGPGPWSRYPAGPSFLAALAAGRAPRAVWTALPAGRSTGSPGRCWSASACG